jgi:hypothetical protein
VYSPRATSLRLGPRAMLSSRGTGTRRAPREEPGPERRARPQAALRPAGICLREPKVRGSNPVWRVSAIPLGKRDCGVREASAVAENGPWGKPWGKVSRRKASLDLPPPPITTRRRISQLSRGILQIAIFGVALARRRWLWVARRRLTWSTPGARKERRTRTVDRGARPVPYLRYVNVVRREGRRR